VDDPVAMNADSKRCSEWIGVHDALCQNQKCKPKRVHKWVTSADEVAQKCASDDRIWNTAVHEIMRKLDSYLNPDISVSLKI
jgi:abortive infection bacteriophage resistance protein